MKLLQWVPNKNELRLSILYILVLAVFMGVLVWRIYRDPSDKISFIAMSVLLTTIWLAYPLFAAFSVRKLISSERPALRIIVKRFPNLLLIFTAMLLLYAIPVLIFLFLFGDRLTDYFQYREEHLVDKSDFIAEGTLAVALLFLLAHEMVPVLFPLGVMALLFPDSDHIFTITWASLVGVGLAFYPSTRLGLWLPYAAATGKGFSESLRWAWSQGGKLWTHIAGAFFESIRHTIWLYMVLILIFYIGPGFMLRFLGSQAVLVVEFVRWPFYITTALGLLLLLAVPSLSSVRFTRRRTEILQTAARGETLPSRALVSFLKTVGFFAAPILVVIGLSVISFLGPFVVLLLVPAGFILVQKIIRKKTSPKNVSS